MSNIFEQYEAEKARIIALNLPHEEYQKAVQLLAERLGI